MKSIKHWIEIQVHSLDGILVYDGKRKSGNSVRRLNKVSAIASFSRNRKTESTHPSLPVQPTGKENTQNKDGSYRYIARWNTDEFDDTRSRRSYFDDEDIADAEPVLLETNLHPRKKEKRNRHSRRNNNDDIDELAPYEPKDFDIFVGMKRQDEFIVFGTSKITINATVDEADIRLPLYPMGEQKKVKHDDNSKVSDYEVEPIHFDNDVTRKFALAKDAYLTATISVSDTASYCIRKMNQLSGKRSLASGQVSRQFSRSRSMSQSQSSRRVQSERRYRSVDSRQENLRTQSDHYLNTSGGVNFRDPSINSFHDNLSPRRSIDRNQTLNDGVSRISMPDELNTVALTMNEGVTFGFTETRDDYSYADNDDEDEYDIRASVDGSEINNNIEHQAQDARSVTFSIAPQDHPRPAKQDDCRSVQFSVAPSVAVTKGPYSQYIDAMYGAVDDFTVATKLTKGREMSQQDAVSTGLSFSQDITVGANTFDQSAYGQSSVFGQGTYNGALFDQGQYGQDSVFDQGTYAQSTVDGTHDPTNYTQRTFDGTYNESTFDGTHNQSTFDGTHNQSTFDGTYNQSTFDGGNHNSDYPEGTFDGAYDEVRFGRQNYFKQVSEEYSNNESFVDSRNDLEGSRSQRLEPNSRVNSMPRKRDKNRRQHFAAKDKKQTTRSAFDAFGDLYNAIEDLAAGEQQSSDSRYSSNSRSTHGDDSGSESDISSSESSTLPPTPTSIRPNSRGTRVAEDITVDGASYAMSRAQSRSGNVAYLERKKEQKAEHNVEYQKRGGEHRQRELELRLQRFQKK